MSNKVTFEEIDNTHENYGILQNSISLNGEPTGRKMIIRNGEYVAIVSDKYYLFPNEEAIKIANQAAKIVGLEKFVPRGRASRRNLLYNESETKVRVFYRAPNTYKIGSDDMNIGVQVYNSINAKLAFGAGIFTFREMCSNGVILGRKDILNVRRIHTPGLENVIQKLKETLVLIMDQVEGVVEAYKLMADRKITEQLLKQIRASKLPKKVLPDFATEEEATIPDLSEWDLYNDITQQIWHNEGGIDRAVKLFDRLHRAMPVIRRF